MRAQLAILAFLCTASAFAQDSDRDGLSDFDEIHKYLTDPKKADSDGDGIPDGDWAERREYAYSVRAVIDVMAPFDLDSMNDDFQDVRVIKKEKDLLRFEVVAYPFASAGQEIGSDLDWRRHSASMKEWLRPGPTTNWNAEVTRELSAELKQKGFAVEGAGDRELVQEAAKLLMERSRFEDGFISFAVEFTGSKPRIHSSLRPEVEKELDQAGRSLEAQFQREVFGAGMIERRVHGSCTSTAIYLATGLKALGIPTRSIVCIPIADSNDAKELALVRKNLHHHRVRKTLLDALAKNPHGWTSHTFNEVFVDGRWRRLNYERLGQGILDDTFLGLMVHVHTFKDHAESGLVGWGLRRKHRRHDELFGGENPYSCVEIDDLFGAHAKVENPEVPDGVPEGLEITKLYWFDDAGKDPIVAMSLESGDGSGHLVAHVDSPVGFEDCNRFYAEVGKAFQLVGPDETKIPATARRGFWCNRDHGLCDFYLQIDPPDFAKMKPGVDYRLETVPSADSPRSFSVRQGLTIRRP